MACSECFSTRFLWVLPKADEMVDFTGLMAMAGGHAEARAIQSALKLGLFEALRPKPLNWQHLAAAIHCDGRATMLLANALVALGLLRKIAGEYGLSDSAQKFLLVDSPEYLGGMILFDEALWSTWGKLDESIRSGRPSRTPDMYQSTPDETERFIRAMDSLVRARGDAIWMAQELDLSWAREVADVGGGPATYLEQFLGRWPHISGVLLDLPATLQVARKILRERGGEWQKRLVLHEFNYKRDEIPGPFDVIFMSNVIHSENEDENLLLIAKCFRALRPGGLLIIKDHIMDTELIRPTAGALFSLYLLLTTEGRDYGFEEITQWLRRAGFSDIALSVLPSPPFSSSMVLARKP
jgi:SAM-dependent methyltransferase